MYTVSVAFWLGPAWIGTMRTRHCTNYIFDREVCACTIIRVLVAHLQGHIRRSVLRPVFGTGVHRTPTSNFCGVPFGPGVSAVDLILAFEEAQAVALLKINRFRLPDPRKLIPAQSCAFANKPSLTNSLCDSPGSTDAALHAF